jgi:hypothetical protein
MLISRRDALKLTAATAVSNVSAASLIAAAPVSHTGYVYELYEATFQGSANGNPFIEVKIEAEFSLGFRTVRVTGFYDGAGIYRVRFLPDTAGEWRYRTVSNARDLHDQQGTILIADRRPGHHGPVRVHNTHHFCYADGTPFFPFGTTCYAWIHQNEELQQQTLTTLKGSPFNKVRMCIFPKHYEYNHNEPPFYPFERSSDGVNNFEHINPLFFQHLERRIMDLDAIGVQADLILFHPYDNWGYQKMSAEQDDRYLRYVLARLSAIPNIWWSVANEFDLMRAKTTADFDRFFHIIEQHDPYAHLRSIHYSRISYDYSRPWVTHASHQTSDFAAAAAQIALLQKPVLFDEVQYEGNLDRRWGNLDGDELAYRFWRGVIAGAYVTHGETILEQDAKMTEDETPTLWWAHGGKLKGTSPAAIGFLRRLVQDTVINGNESHAGLEGSNQPYYANAVALDANRKTTTILYFFDQHRPLWYEFPLPEGNFSAEMIDPIAMTITPLPGKHSGKARLRLGSRMYQALRFRAI